MRGNGVVYSTVDRSGHEESNGLPCVIVRLTLVRAPYGTVVEGGLRQRCGTQAENLGWPEKAAKMCLWNMTRIRDESKS